MIYDICQSIVAVTEKAARGFLNLIYPMRCLVCEVPLEPMNRYHLCARCAREIRPNPRPWCIRCGRAVERAHTLCSECRRARPRFERAYSVCLYGGVLKECIHLFKYNERLRLSRILSELMVDFIKTNRQIIDDVDIIVPVPLSAGRLWQRGYNQSEILARALAKELGLSFSNALVKTKSTRPQSELKRDRRLNNVRGVFGIRRGARIAGKTILLVDDVLTTGSTLNECARILLESGAGRIRALTLARGI